MGRISWEAEDADLCIRAWRAGWRVICCGDAPVTHHRSQVITSATWQYYSTRNRVWFTRSTFGRAPATLNLLLRWLPYRGSRSRT